LSCLEINNGLILYDKKNYFINNEYMYKLKNKLLKALKFILFAIIVLLILQIVPSNQIKHNDIILLTLIIVSSYCLLDVLYPYLRYNNI
jgi:hypothetical protein